MDARKSNLIHAAIAGLLAVGPATALLSSSAFAADDFKCEGANSCKAKGDCGGKGHSCAGQNKCKGEGWVKTADAKACDALKAAPNAGAKK